MKAEITCREDSCNFMKRKPQQVIRRKKNVPNRTLTFEIDMATR